LGTTGAAKRAFIGAFAVISGYKLKETRLNQNLTEIVAILDRSGSMESISNDTIGGYNAFIKEQKEISGEAVLTTVLFNDIYKLLHDRVNIKTVKPLTGKQYTAGGNTALLDALGKTIYDTGVKLNNTPEHERPAKVVFFIITDGEENASTEFTREKVKSMVELQKNTYKWEFIFLGANIDAFSTAASIGISSDRSFDFDTADIAGVQKAVGIAVSNLRKFSDIDKGLHWRERIKKH
jgi:hypothetical protein